MPSSAHSDSNGTGFWENADPRGSIVWLSIAWKFEYLLNPKCYLSETLSLKVRQHALSPGPPSLSLFCLLPEIIRTMCKIKRFFIHFTKMVDSFQKVRPDSNSEAKFTLKNLIFDQLKVLMYPHVQNKWKLRSESDEGSHRIHSTSA